MNKTRRGSLGEKDAVDFLEKKGYCVLAQNYRFERNEIDIIAQDGDTLVFIEVKARTSTKYGEPIEAVTEAKQRRIRSAAEGYLYQQSIEDIPCRFDVIGVLYRNKQALIEHVEDAF